MPLALSDEELAAVMGAAKPLPARDRPAFLEDVASELANYPEIGPGVIGKMAMSSHNESSETSVFRGGLKGFSF
jgi:hypothetical protein